MKEILSERISRVRRIEKVSKRLRRRLATLSLMGVTQPAGESDD